MKKGQLDMYPESLRETTLYITIKMEKNGYAKIINIYYFASRVFKITEDKTG